VEVGDDPVIEQLTDLFPMIFLAACISLAASPLMIRVARKSKLIDVPGSASHKLHEAPTPLAGGLILVAALAIAYVLLRPAVDATVLGISLAGLWIFAWGLVDDRVNLRPQLKLAGQLGSPLILLLAGIQVHITRIPILDIFLTILWMVGMMNAFNFVDSMDDLALGIAGAAAAFFMLVTIDSHQPQLSMLSAAILGAAIGMYPFGAAPAHVFLGDSGSLTLGCLLAGIGIAYTPGQAGLPQGLTWFTPILVLGVPIFDMVLVVFSRLRRHLPVYRAGRDHTYHRLVRLGLGSNRAVIIMQLAGVLLGLIAFIALAAGVLLANSLFLLVVLAGVGLVLRLDRTVDT